MDLDEIRGLIEQLTGLMEAKELEELEIETGGMKIALRRSRRGGEPHAVAASPAGPSPPLPRPADRPADAAAEAPQAGQHVIRSEMVGTFYRASAPDAEPFVDVGDEVSPDTVVCIIEAMKVMNELKAEIEGTLVGIRAEDGEAVEYGQPLFVIATRA